MIFFFLICKSKQSRETDAKNMGVMVFKNHLNIQLELKFRETDSNLKISNTVFKKTNQKVFS